MQPKYRYQLIATVIISMILLALSLSFLLLPKKTFSENENKVLAGSPQFSFKTVTNGSFMKDAEIYITDHFPLRTTFLQLKTHSEVALGKTEKNGVLLANDHYLIQDYPQADQEHLGNVADTINKFVTQNPQFDISVMIVPNSVAINTHRLPRFYSGTDQGQIINELYQKIEGVVTIDLTASLKTQNQQEDMYYHLDHHWTSMGAYVGYKTYCVENNIDHISENGFEHIVVSDDFYGTMASKASVYNYPPDSIVRYIPNEKQELIVQYYDSYGELSKQSNTLYEDDYLTKKDQYASFLNANQPLIIIENKLAQKDKKLMIVKDSYANCLIPFLVEHFSEIYVVDLRYYDHFRKRDHENKRYRIVPYLV